MTEKKETSKQEINTGRDYRETHLEDRSTYVEGNVEGNIHNAETIIINPEPKNREQALPKRSQAQKKLLYSVQNEAKGRLEQSLHNRISTPPNQRESPSQANPPWETDFKIGNYPPERLPQEITIADIYDRGDINGRLLILGEAGSGKTTTLLHLAQELTKRACDDTNQPIPIILNLSSWRDNIQSIQNWIITEVNNKYDICKDTVQKWLTSGTISLLLDGLDEVAPDLQEKCIESLNDFLQPNQWEGSLVVCSRNEVYELDLNNSICLQPLTQEKTQDYVMQTGGEKLWNKLKGNTNLLTRAKNPLLLNIIIFSFQEYSSQERQALGDNLETLEPIFNSYFHSIFKSNNKKDPFQENTQYCLKHIAEQLTEQSKAEFSVEDIQPFGLLDEFKKYIYQATNLLFSGLPFGLVAGIITVLFVSNSIEGKILEILETVFQESKTLAPFLILVSLGSIVLLSSSLSLGVCSQYQYDEITENIEALQSSWIPKNSNPQNLLRVEPMESKLLKILLLLIGLLFLITILTNKTLSNLIITLISITTVSSFFLILLSLGIFYIHKCNSNDQSTDLIEIWQNFLDKLKNKLNNKSSLGLIIGETLIILIPMTILVFLLFATLRFPHFFFSETYSHLSQICESREITTAFNQNLNSLFKSLSIIFIDSESSCGYKLISNWQMSWPLIIFSLKITIQLVIIETLFRTITFFVDFICKNDYLVDFNSLWEQTKSNIIDSKVCELAKKTALLTIYLGILIISLFFCFIFFKNHIFSYLTNDLHQENSQIINAFNIFSKGINVFSKGINIFSLSVLWINLLVVFGVLFGFIGVVISISNQENQLHIYNAKNKRNFKLIGGLLGVFIGIRLALDIGANNNEGLSYIFNVLFLEAVYGFICALIGWTISELIYGKVCELYLLYTESEFAPNQRMQKLLANATVFGLCSGLFFSTTCGLLFDPLTGLAVGILFGLITGLMHGGQALAQHFALRLVLYCSGKMPWNYTHFLDNYTKLSLLQNVGGRYQFTHRMVQEHLAQMPSLPPTE